MADPFDVPDVEDGEETPPGAVGDTFDVPDVSAEATARAAASGEPSWVDYMLAGTSGVGGGGLARLGQQFGDALAGERPQGAQVVGGGVLEQVPETDGTAVAEFAGNIGTAIPAAIAAGPAIGAQAALGAGLGASGAYGKGQSMLGGALVGGALGAAGGAVAKGAGKLLEPLSTSMHRVAGTAGELAEQSVTRGEQALLELAKSQPTLASTIMKPWEAIKYALGMGAVKTASEVGKRPGAVRAAAQLAGGAAPGADLAGALVESTAKAQEAPSTWAVQSVLSSGNSGLAPADEARLTDAVMSGDSDRIAAQSFSAQMKSPAHQSRVRQQLESAQRREE